MRSADEIVNENTAYSSSYIFFSSINCITSNRNFICPWPEIFWSNFQTRIIPEEEIGLKYNVSVIVHFHLEKITEGELTFNKKN